MHITSSNLIPLMSSTIIILLRVANLSRVTFRSIFRTKAYANVSIRECFDDS